MCSVYLFFMQTTGKNPFGCWGYAEKNQKNCGYFKKILVEFYLIG